MNNLSVLAVCSRKPSGRRDHHPYDPYMKQWCSLFDSVQTRQPNASILAQLKHFTDFWRNCFLAIRDNSSRRANIVWGALVFPLYPIYTFNRTYRIRSSLATLIILTIFSFLRPFPVEIPNRDRGFLLSPQNCVLHLGKPFRPKEQKWLVYRCNEHTLNSRVLQYLRIFTELKIQNKNWWHTIYDFSPPKIYQRFLTQNQINSFFTSTSKNFDKNSITIQNFSKVRKQCYTLHKCANHTKQYPLLHQKVFLKSILSKL